MPHNRPTYSIALALLGALIVIAIIVGAVRAAAVGDAGRPATQPAATPDADWKPRDAETEAFFARPVVARLRVELSEAAVKALRKDPRTYVKATVREELPTGTGRAYADVGVRLKGGAGSFRGIDAKPGLTLDFSEFVSGQRFYGMAKLHLNNAVQDPTYLAQHLGGWAMRRAGIPAARIANARVQLNDRDLGLYCVAEAVDKDFLRRWFGEDEGTLYDGDRGDIDARLAMKIRNVGEGAGRTPPDAKPLKRAKRKAGRPASGPAGVSETLAVRQRQELAERQALGRLTDLLEATREADPHDRRARLGEVIDVDRFLTMAAMEALIVHWDGYGANSNNYRIYDDPGTGRLTFLPHGMDQVFQGEAAGIAPKTGLVARALLEDAEMRGRYYERLAILRQTALDAGALAGYLDEVAARIGPALAETDVAAAEQFRRDAIALRERVFARAEFVDRLLAQVLSPLPFDDAGMAIPFGWSLSATDGRASLGKLPGGLLRVRSGPEGCAAALRTTVVLPPGRYALEGRYRADGIAAPELDAIAAPNAGVGLRIAGGHRAAGLIGTTDWAATAYEFEITGPGDAEVTLMCEVRAAAGDATFDPSALRVRRR